MKKHYTDVLLMSGNLPKARWQGVEERPEDSGSSRSGSGASASVPKLRTRGPRVSKRPSSSRFEQTPGSFSRQQMPRPKESSPRFLLEALVVLAIAVSIFRTFLLEGFMISTGSMAPALLGYHYRLTCPDCGHTFAVSATERAPALMPKVSEADEETPFEAAGEEEHGPAVKCPNCQYAHIQLNSQIVHEGDQLLVEKQAYQWQPPRRWNAVIFRNPNRSLQAFAKRIIGLPGEVISLKEGDVYVKETIQRKTLTEQKEVRILVSDSHYQPRFQDADWRSNWQPAGELAQKAWQQTEQGYRFEPPAAAIENPEPAWLQYSRWVRQGGTLKTTVSLERWPIDIPLPTAQTGLHYDPVKQQLFCQGALPAEIAEKLQALSTDVSFRRAIDQLFQQSHQQPITDQLAYIPQRQLQEKRVRDVMVELELQPESMQSRFQIRMHDGQYAFVCSMDLSSRTGELKIEGQESALRTGPLPELQFEQPIKIVMSLFDRQVLVAVNDQLIFEPYAFRASEKPVEPIRIPIAVAASGAPLELLRQRVYRDVYYRPLPRDQNEGSTPVEYRLGPEEYFVLGDNSAVSVDSRHWPAGSVTAGLLIGRPVILHLPSQKKEIAIGPYTTRIRVPDLERIRLLR